MEGDGTCEVSNASPVSRVTAGVTALNLPSQVRLMKDIAERRIVYMYYFNSTNNLKRNLCILRDEPFSKS